MQFSAEFHTDHLDRALAAVRNEVSHPALLLGNIGESLYRVNSLRHEAGTDPDGNAWKELAKSTKESGPRKGGPLKKTGRMLQSFHYQVESDVLNLGFDGERDSKLAAIHNGGTDPYTISPVKAKALKIGDKFYKRVHHPGLPARRLIGFPESDQRVVADVLVDHITAIMQGVR